MAIGLATMVAGAAALWQSEARSVQEIRDTAQIGERGEMITTTAASPVFCFSGTYTAQTPISPMSVGVNRHTTVESVRDMSAANFDTVLLPTKRFNDVRPSCTAIVTTSCAPDGLCMVVTIIDGSIPPRPPAPMAATTLSAIPGSVGQGGETVVSWPSVGAAPRAGNLLQGWGEVVKGMLRRVEDGPTDSEIAAAGAVQVLKRSTTTLTVFETEKAATVVYYPPTSSSSLDGLPDITTITHLTTKTTEPSQDTSSYCFTSGSIVSCDHHRSTMAPSTTSLAMHHIDIQTTQAYTTVYTTVVANSNSSSSSASGIIIGNPLRPGWSATIANMSVLDHPWTAAASGLATDLSINISTFSADLPASMRSYLSAEATPTSAEGSGMVTSSTTVVSVTPHMGPTSAPAKSGDAGFAGFTPATTVNIGSSGAAGGAMAGLPQVIRACMALAILSLATVDLL